MEQLQVIQNKIYKIRGTRYMPFAFTKQGMAMLSSVLNNETAIEININIMRAFVTVRQYLTSAKAPSRRLRYSING